MHIVELFTKFTAHLRAFRLRLEITLLPHFSSERHRGKQQQVESRWRLRFID